MIREFKDLDDAVSASVRAERARLRLTRDELAERLGWSIGRIRELEHSQLKIDLEFLPPLCRVLGVPLSQLVKYAADDDLAALDLSWRPGKRTA